jgi:hypothetical protein
MAERTSRTDSKKSQSKRTKRAASGHGKLKTKKGGNLVAGAVVGGVVAGPVGAVVGAAVASKTNKGPVQRKRRKGKAAPVSRRDLLKGDLKGEEPTET